ncbi:hypothetical protein ACQ859_20685 [Roseateles chitinivorans]|uniref:hypothetical protein n=1 Tax=Roseateles chitinivorans TaxID=2917965 RepID=UPI003D66E908
MSGWRRVLRGIVLFWLAIALLLPLLLFPVASFWTPPAHFFQALPGLGVVAETLRWLIYLGGAAAVFGVLFPLPIGDPMTGSQRFFGILLVVALSLVAPLGWRHGYLPLAATARGGTEQVLPGRIVLVRPCCARGAWMLEELELGFELQGEAGTRHLARFDNKDPSKHWSEYDEFRHWHPKVGDEVLVTVKRNLLGRSVVWIAPAAAR